MEGKWEGSCIAGKAIKEVEEGKKRKERETVGGKGKEKRKGV